MTTKKQKRVVALRVATIAQEADCGPCYILPADAASYTQMVAQCAEGLAIRHGHPWGCCGDARAALAAIGIKQPKP